MDFGHVYLLVTCCFLPFFVLPVSPPRPPVLILAFSELSLSCTYLYRRHGHREWHLVHESLLGVLQSRIPTPVTGVLTSFWGKSTVEWSHSVQPSGGSSQLQNNSESTRCFRASLEAAKLTNLLVPTSFHLVLSNESKFNCRCIAE